MPLKMMFGLMCRASTLSICVASFVIGAGIVLLCQRVDLELFLLFLRTWLAGESRFANRSSLALLTLVDVGKDKKSFSVAVLPTKEVEETAAVAPLSRELEIILKKALEFRDHGNPDRSLKLLRQCKNMSPPNPDILNYLGEGMESDDIIEAEHHYALALVLQPGHLKANENRRRCLPRVKEKDLEMLRRIEAKRDALIKIPEGNTALQRAKLEAYYKHIYHSNGIEGNTMTLSMTRSIVETGMAIGGKSVMEHNEVLGLDAALKFINNTLINEDRAVTVADILDIHKRVLGYTHPIDAGLFRQTQVYVGDHKPPGPEQVESYMRAFDKWLRSEDVALLHPIELAALAHYKLVYIHPFLDGNGRTSRLLMNLFLMRAGYPPVIIRKEQRYDYYEYLQLGNLGDVRPFIRFVARCTEHTLDYYLSSVTIFPHDRESAMTLEDADDASDTGVLRISSRFDPFFQAENLTDAGASQTNNSTAKNDTN